MTTRILVVNEGPEDVSVVSSNSNGADLTVLKIGQHTEKYVHSSCEVTVKEITKE